MMNISIPGRYTPFLFNGDQTTLFESRVASGPAIYIPIHLEIADIALEADPLVRTKANHSPTISLSNSHKKNLLLNF